MRHVVLAGLITSACVHHTAHGAFCRGYHVSLLHDACGDRSRERHQAALEIYGGFMYDVVSTECWEESCRTSASGPQVAQRARL